MEFEFNEYLIVIEKLPLETDTQYEKRVELIFKETSSIDVIKDRISNSVYLHYIINDGCSYSEEVEKAHHIIRKT